MINRGGQMEKYIFQRKEVGGLGKPPVIVLKEKEGIPYFSFPLLEQTGKVEHLFTTRMGGVSTGIYSSMNLSFTRGDEANAVKENYSRIASLLSCGVEDIVCSDQTHTSNIREVTTLDRGKGIIRQKDYKDIDGLVTNEKGLCLSLFFADCVPVYFLDPVKEVIGLAHSGWKGTAEKISLHMVQRMQEVYGCRPEDILATVGPSICQTCYEVSQDVADVFRVRFSSKEQQIEILKEGKEEGKYQLDLWNAVSITLLEAGILEEHVAVTDVCTCCNPELLFSHRASAGRRGNLGAFMKLKK